jgi:methionyl-tRNA formyltransferase
MGNNIETYILVSEKKWHDSLFDDLQKNTMANWVRIKQKTEFTFKNLTNLQPKKIFIPHWSNIIPSEIYLNWECIVFHMTDLPYGRGGSPLQNLILNEKKETFISAIKVEKGIDTGDIYLKAPLNLKGTANEIFRNAANIIHQMIIDIIKNNPIPKIQEGEIIVFKRRTPNESNIEHLESISKIYDYIRMLDCVGYPHAFLETQYFKFEFTQADLKNDIIDAHVRIIKK